MQCTNRITRSHETDKKTVDRNRDESGCNLHPFQDGNLKKYGTTRKSNDATIADEYPLASSIEGGVGTQYGRAIVQGATKGDQQGKPHLDYYSPLPRAKLSLRSIELD